MIEKDKKCIWARFNTGVKVKSKQKVKVKGHIQIKMSRQKMTKNCIWAKLNAQF